MTDIMTNLYHNRLKSLIGYEDVSHTRSIIKKMFDLFDKISGSTDSYGYKNAPQKLSDILTFMYKDYSTYVSDCKGHVLFFIHNLENFQEKILPFVIPDWKTLYPDVKCRKVFGKRFMKIHEDTPELFPKSLRNPSILAQLNYTTLYRNHDVHKEVVRNSDLFSRYYILYGYELILTYLLYTFYYMAIDNENEHSFVNP